MARGVQQLSPIPSICMPNTYLPLSVIQQSTLTFLRQQPYLLPCIVSSSISVFAIIMCGLFVREVRDIARDVLFHLSIQLRQYDPIQTLPSKVAAQKAAAESKKLTSHDTPSYGSTSTSASTRTSSPNPPSTPTATHKSGASTPTLANVEERRESQPAKPKFELPVPAKTTGVFYLLSKPHIRAVLASGFMFSLLGVGTDVVFVLYSYTRIDLGGMGRSVITPFVPSLWPHLLATCSLTFCLYLLPVNPSVPQCLTARPNWLCLSWFGCSGDHRFSRHLPLHPTAIQQSSHVHLLLRILGTSLRAHACR
jgi:hypothetical protein